MTPFSKRRTPEARTLAALAFGVCVVIGTTVDAHADAIVVTDATVATAITQPQVSAFGLGGSASAAAFFPLNRLLLVGFRARGLLLSGSGDVPVDVREADPDLGGLAAVSANFRLRPLASRDRRRSPGLSIEIGAGAALTGSVVRPTLEAGLGWGFDLGVITLGPTLRFVQVIQPRQGLDPRDARLALGGLEVIFLDREDAPRPPRPPVRRDEPADRDHDGVVDAEDQCADEPEDVDGFEDADGCPEPDNDADGIADAEDACPNEPEDRDEWDDSDGCPDPDNDADEIADANDQCPNDPEVVNGINDQDGCPDQGEIMFIEGRVTLDEQVLFDPNRARVRHRAFSMLRAIVNLWSQHPDWVGLKLEGHADIRGPAEFNWTLSERRARNVRTLLVRFGMSPDMIQFQGLGETQPVAEGRNEAAHRRNRRVVFIAVTRQPDGQARDVEVLDASESGNERGEP